MQVFITELTAEVGDKNSQLLRRYGTSPFRFDKTNTPQDISLGKQRGTRFICQQLIKKFTPWDTNSLALKIVIRPPPVIVGEDRVQDATPLRV